jgi:DNA-binding CsgD family transcriptional regulator
MAHKFFNKRQLEFIQKGFGYSDRQMKIIQLIFQKLNNVGVAKEAKITYNTAKTHVRNICRKANAHSRAELILTLLNCTRHLRNSKD